MQLVFLLSMNRDLQHVDRTIMILLFFSVLYSCSAYKKEYVSKVWCACVCVEEGGEGEDPHRLT